MDLTKQLPELKVFECLIYKECSIGSQNYFCHF